MSLFRLLFIYFFALFVQIRSNAFVFKAKNKKGKGTKQTSNTDKEYQLAALFWDCPRLTGSESESSSPLEE